ncbi:MAG: hypothetical protein D6681_12110 [Calditrichaeota bacterium]|nr:MAG: hypothetical protein D6681_12110 [Calditrichota bacterium]
MNYHRFGRTLVPEGGLFDDVESALQFAEANEADILAEQLQNLTFTTDEEGVLQVLINNKRYYITHSALKDLCKMLKVPASYINKFPGRDLVLENLNENPYLKENAETVKLVIWQGEAHPVIAGVLPGGDAAMPAGEYLSFLQEEGVFERENTLLDQIAFSGEELVLYFYLPEEMNRDRMTINLGYAIHYSPTRYLDTFIYPFCKMAIVAPTGEPFDFDFEGTHKLHVVKRKQDDFISQTLELSRDYMGEDLGAYFEEVLKYATVAKNEDAVKYSLLKFFKAKALSAYNYDGIKVDPNEAAQEIIPEYKEFYSENKEQLKQMATYSANNLLVHFSLPVFFNRLFTYPASIENPYYLIRYRRAIGVMLNKVLDDKGDFPVDAFEE